MTTITIDRALLERAMDMIPPTTVKKIALKKAIRAELAKPVESAAPITLEQFRAIAHRTATTYRHRSDPEKSSYAFVDGSSLDDFWLKVCEAIQPTSAWHDAPTCAGLWLCFENGYAYAYPEEWDKGFAYGEDSRWYGPIPQDGEKS